MDKIDIIKVTDEQQVIKTLWKLIEDRSLEAIAERGVFRIGLSGGSLIKYLTIGAGSPDNQITDWSKWKLYFCDERFVPEDDKDSTFGEYKRDFLPKTGLKVEQFERINIDNGLIECARDYEERIFKEFSIDPKIPRKTNREIPRFDLLLLGMGPDGHTCSLFPNHRLLLETESLVAPINDSPKPPPERVTMTYPLINNAFACAFAISGAGKAEMIKNVLVNREILPAGLVEPVHGRLYWIVDESAGLSLPS